MNTVKSFWLGWGSLCVAGGGAYYFAKQQINAERQAKVEAHRKKMQKIEELQYAHDMSANGNGSPARTDSAGSPSQEASSDPAPTRHAPATEAERVDEKSKFESNVPYKSRKGDRFS
ncbi:Fc.00g047830.m01.CDS01 [Cosmosporella sp. VM-42]